MVYISKWKLYFFSLVTIISILLVLPTFLPYSVRDKWPSFLPQKQIILGLDLKGGVNLLLEVDESGLLQDRYGQMAPLVRKLLREKKIRYHHFATDAGRLSFQLFDTKDFEMAKEALLKEYAVDGIEVSLLETKVLLSFQKPVIQQMLRQAVDKSIEVIRQRIDETGAVEPILLSQGERRIILQIPGFEDPAKVKEMLGKTAKLSLQWVEDEPSSHTKDLPLLDREDERPDLQKMHVNTDILISGEMVMDAKVAYGEKGDPVVSFALNGQGAKIFSMLTRDNIGKRLAIILDDQILSAPRIQTHIPGGSAVITGMKTVQEAQKLALLIRSGALPAPLKILEEKVIGPGLGRDSIQAGVFSTVLAVLAVMIFMLLGYSVFGIFAVIGIFYNLLFLFAALAFFGSALTLTLPGIAGIALTIGMAVDANVLINERIKEELALGRRLLMAIDSGYRRAMASIIDSNATTLIGAALMYFLGSGPVKGFAITMALGIIISMFTAIQLTRFLVALWARKANPQTLKI